MPKMREKTKPKLKGTLSQVTFVECLSGVKRELISSLTEIVVTPSIRKRLGYTK